MLKIKDNVDLKELEKFGFEASECPSGAIQYRKTLYEDGDLAYFIYIEFLFDLIQAGLVEKVVEK